MSNPRRIECGDTVYVMFPNHPQNGRAFRALVENVPTATGESWIFEDLTNGGILYISEPVTISLQEKGSTP